jgi:enoyl-CoA hydratase/carnithine racemase
MTPMNYPTLALHVAGEWLTRASGGERHVELVQDVAVAIVRHPKPLVAAVHGWTVGAGFEWTMDADVVVAADDTRFKLPEASIGVFVTGGLVATLPAITGLSRAKAMMLLGTVQSTGRSLDGCVPTTRGGRSDRRCKLQARAQRRRARPIRPCD